MSRTRLVLDGNHLTYVEPQAVTPGRGGLLLAGTPSYLWNRDTAVKNPAFGVVVATDGTVRRVPWPTASHSVGDMRAVQLGDGSWGVIFAELEPGSEFPHEVFRHLWYGTFDGHAWRDLVQLPLPREGTLDPGLMSEIAVHDDTLAVGETVTEVHTPPSATILMHERGRWSSNDLDSRSIDYVTPAHLRGIGWQALVIRGDSVDTNAPYLYQLDAAQLDRSGRDSAERDSAWLKVGKAVRRGRAPLHFPRYLSSHNTWALSWLAIQRGSGWSAVQVITGVSPPGPVTTHALVAPAAAAVPATETMLTIDTAAAGYAATTSPGGTMLWVTDHEVTQSGDAADELRFVLLRSGTPVVLGSIPNPFMGPFAVAMPSDSEIVVSGPLAQNYRTPSFRLSTLLIRLHVQCGASPR